MKCLEAVWEVCVCVCVCVCRLDGGGFRGVKVRECICVSV